MLRNMLIGLLLGSSLLWSCGPAEVKTPEPVEETAEDVIDVTDNITWDDCGGAIGDKACDFTFIDQNAVDWNLYEHYGTVMILDFSAIWCGVCRNIASDAQVIQDTFTDQGYDFIWVTILVDGASWGVSPSPDEIDDWVDSYGMTSSPVLTGDRSVIDTSGADGYPVSGWPTLVIVDETLTITHGINGWNEAAVMGWLEDVLLAAQ